jgi:hypothetical protein
MRIESIARSFGFSGINMGEILDAVSAARRAGSKVYLHVNWQQLQNNGAETDVFRHDWRFKGGKETAHVVEPGFAGLQNAIAKAMLEAPAPDEGNVYFPLAFAINDNPDFADWD